MDKASHPLWVHAGPPRGPPRAVLLEADSLKTQDLLSMEPEFCLFFQSSLFWDQMVSFKALAISKEEFAFYGQIHLGERVMHLVDVK